MAPKPDYHLVCRSEKQTLDSLELSRDDGSLLGSAADSHQRLHLGQSLRTFSTWTIIRGILSAACLITWAASMALAWNATRELAQVRKLLAPQTEPEYTFLSGGHANVPGYGLVYNHTYCNGLKDPEGAKQRGCVFDPAAGGWIHHLCLDSELRDWWFSMPDFVWYEDFNRTKPISQEQVWAGAAGDNGFLFTVDDFHFRHCEYVVRQVIKHVTTPKTEQRGTGLGFLNLDRDHMYHCLDRVVNFNTPEIRNAQTESVHIFGFGLGSECYMPLP